MPPTNAPPAQDTSRNEYIPSFISQKPFYVTDDIQGDADYLEHQRLHAAPKDTLDKAKWYDRGKKLGPAATKFRKGACENCGAMTHKTKECLSRPRKQGAKYTGRDIQADEVVDSVKLGWDAKRDRWNGYDAKEYDAVVQEYNDLEALKSTSNPNQPALEDAAPDSDARYGEETDMGRSQPTSTRQLRLREDTAAYLTNLDLESARYDPKTRSMDTETKSLQDPNSGDLADQGFMRPSEAEAFERAQRYAWESQQENNSSSTSIPNATKIHLQANPTEGAVLLRKAEAEATAKKDAQRQYLLDRYGTASPTNASSANNTTSSLTLTNPSSTTTNKPKTITSSSTYLEYHPSGAPKLTPSTKPTARSKYPEDIHPNNHTSVFGSWWHNFTWGYSCCHSTVRNSYCTGEEGKVAFAEAEGRRTGLDLIPAASTDGVEGVKDAADSTSEAVNGGQREPGEEAPGRNEDRQRRGEEEEEEEDRARELQKKEDKDRGKKRTRHELASGISEEEMEAYKRSKLDAEDPMAKMLGRAGEELL